jgi:hypothetical protein
MSTSYTATETAPRELAGKIAADLRQFSIYYGHPSANQVRDYLQELEILLRGGYLSTYTFGFWREGRWVMCYRYTIQQGTVSGGPPGGVQPNQDVRGASYLNFTTHTQNWWNLPLPRRDAIEASLPIKRTSMDAPGYSVDGSWIAERSYGAGGIEVLRQFFRT